MKRLALALLLLGTTAFFSNQALSRNDIFANIGNGFAWSGSAQAGWNGDHTLVTKSDFVTYVKNNGSCAGGQPNSYVMVYSDMQACAQGGGSHSPILTNNSFTNGSFASWSADAVTGCSSGNSFSGVQGADEDGTNGYASANSGTCYPNAAGVGLNQSFSIGAAPSGQSYSFWYKAPLASIGDAQHCSVGYGKASNLVLKINGVIVSTTVAPVLDTTWHQVTGTTTALVNGSNTIDASVQLISAQGATYQYYHGTYTCKSITAAQFFNVDNFVLTASY